MALTPAILFLMDELEIQGKKYISSKRAAELTGYAKDYIGQMARSGKLPGTRMGRAWYVEKDALLGKRAKEEAETNEIAEKEKVTLDAPKPPEVFKPKKTVSPAMLKALGYIPSPVPVTWTMVTYAPEERDLFPRPVNASVAAVTPLSSAVNSATHSIEPIQREVRIRILRDRVRPNQVLRPEKRQVVVAKAKEINKKRKHKDLALSMGVLTAAMGIFLFFSAGLFLGSNLTLDGSNGVYTANVLVGFQYIRDFLVQYPPVQMGVHALVGFFSILVSSFGDFLLKGIGFLKETLVFLFGN